jgi:hypothetical protein
MKAEDVIRMAREAGLYAKCEVHSAVPFDQLLERFAVLVAAAEREAIKWNSIHSCHADCQNPACVIVREAVAAEREACAALCDKISDDDGFEGGYANYCAHAIRARGQE